MSAPAVRIREATSALKDARERWCRTQRAIGSAASYPSADAWIEHEAERVNFAKAWTEFQHACTPEAVSELLEAVDAASRPSAEPK